MRQFRVKDRSRTYPHVSRSEKANIMKRRKAVSRPKRQVKSPLGYDASGWSADHPLCGTACALAPCWRRRTAREHYGWHALTLVDVRAQLSGVHPPVPAALTSRSRLEFVPHVGI